MTLPDQIQVLLGLMLVSLLIGVDAATVYMDKYGHCIGDDFDLDGDVYTILPRGGGLQHETLYCDLTFKARAGHGVCLTFEKFNIKDCRVTLKIYDKNSASGRSWRSFKCKDEMPTQMCTSERYVTIALSKEKLNRNKNYNFNIQIQESKTGAVVDPAVGAVDGKIGETITGEDVFFASIGIFVAIIVGVIVLIITIAVVIICCCCKNRQRPQGSRYQATSTSPPPVQPSAPPPPAPTQYFASQNPVPPLYPHLPSEAPPPYSPHAPSCTQPGYGPQSMYTGEPEIKQPVV